MTRRRVAPNGSCFWRIKVRRGLIPSPFRRTAFSRFHLCGADPRADPLVRARLPGPALRQGYKFSITEQADGGVGRGLGGPPHPTQAAANFSRLSVASPTYRLEPVVV